MRGHRPDRAGADEVADDYPGRYLTLGRVGAVEHLVEQIEHPLPLRRAARRIHDLPQPLELRHE